MDNKRKTSEVRLFIDGVVVYIVGPFKEEAAFAGKLMIVNEYHGAVIEWHPVREIKSTENARSSPEAETLDWEDVSSAVVGYTASHDGDKGVEIKTTKAPNPIAFDLSDLKSFKRVENIEEEKINLTFFLKDGTNIPSFHFETSSFITFLEALQTYVVFRKSKKDSNLYLIYDPKVEALEKSFSELELFGENKGHIVTKFFQDPYATAMGSFSKVTNYLLEYVVYGNGASLPTQCSDEEVANMLTESLPTVQIDHHEEPGYELITCIEMPPRPVVKRIEPVTVEEWMSYVDSEGRIKDVEALKLRIFKGGLVHTVRSEAWKFLLGYYSFDSSNKERNLWRVKKKSEYFDMKLQWKSMRPDQESRFAALRERKSLIEKDVSRTDRTHPFFEGDNNDNVQMLYDILMTYCMHNFDLGYVQGMSDILSPILVIMQNECDAFWCFAGWMEKIGANFELDQQRMKTQLQSLHRLIHFADSQLCNYLENHESGNLYFAFRWLLILFKRDFKFQEIMRLWEVLWTELPCQNFHLLICAAILDTEKLTIMENNYGLTEILKHINDMSYKINLEETLCKAEAIYLQICNCTYRSDVVEGILGIETPSKPEKPRTPPVPVQKKSAECEKTALPSSTEKNHEKSTSPCSADSLTNLDDYEDLEQQYQISFGLFT